MPLTSKVLWIVNMGTESAEVAFSKHALAINATAVCIRTSSKRLPDSVKRFHDLGLKLFGWRWPSASDAAAMREADYVATKCIRAGLDGYIVDPESDKAGAANDWNRAGLGPLAAKFCAAIKNAAPPSFTFGTTSGCAYPGAGGKPHIPWAEFFGASDVLLPQTYWRWTNPSSGARQKINGGTPAKAIAKGAAAWTPELTEYGAELARIGVTEGHFYTDNGRIPVVNLAAIKAL